MNCIICRTSPRDGDRLSCTSLACVEAVHAMPLEELEAVREREVLEHWKANPPPADGSGVYVHIMEKGE